MKLFRLFSFVVLALVLHGCSPKQTRISPIPEESYEQVTPTLESQLIRFWGDIEPARSVDSVLYGGVIEEQYIQLAQQWSGRELSFLALSGGGPNGAYGAGFLNGWTRAGTRPEFSIVTGISTGALIAPFAFLGSSSDSLITEFFTTLSSDDLVEERRVLSAIRSDALMDSDGLKEKIDLYFTEDVMRAIEMEYNKGSILLIGTTNMDALRPVIWNIGKIASLGTPEALSLIRQVIYASASIPLAFPPVIIDVVVNGEPYQEIHSDGGVTSQVFLFPAELDWKRLSQTADIDPTPELYIICNDRINPVWMSTETQITDLASRAIISLIRSTTVGDLYKIYLISQENNFNYNLTYVPKSFTLQSEEIFDRSYMKALYDIGYEEGLSQATWKAAPPEMRE